MKDNKINQDIINSTNESPTKQINHQSYQTPKTNHNSPNKLHRIRKLQQQFQQRKQKKDRVDSGYFIPSLQILCAATIAKNFRKFTSHYPNLPLSLKNQISKFAQVNLPLQITVPYFDDENYWKRCCLSRWSRGQLGMLTVDTDIHQQNNIAVQADTQQDLNDSFGQHAKTWKQVYLEKNLQEMLEFMPSPEMIDSQIQSYMEKNRPTQKQMESKMQEFESAGFELHSHRASYFIWSQKEDEKFTPKYSFDSDDTYYSTYINRFKHNTQDLKKEKQFSEHSELNPEHNPSNNTQFNESLFPTLSKMKQGFREEIQKKDHKQSDGDKNDDQENEDSSKRKYGGIQMGEFTTQLEKVEKDIASFESSPVFKSYSDFNSNHPFASMNNSEISQSNSENIRRFTEFCQEMNESRLNLLCQICSNYIEYLLITSSNIRFEWSKVLNNLDSLQELSITFGVSNAGMNFEFNMCGMKEKDCRDLSSALSDNKSIKILRLPENLIDTNRCKLLLKGLVRNDSLRVLDFSHNKIEGEGAAAIAALLSKNKKISSLNLCDNMVHDKEATLIAKALQDNMHLEKLNLRLNRIGDDGGLFIAEALKRNSHLKFVNLSNNEMGEKTAKAFFGVLEKNSSLKQLDLSGNGFGSYSALLLDYINENSNINVDLRSSTDNDL
eukprot:gb/GECH01003173.1/.p1 GENE.gb/GECH01003173.1/~~gb/GECH01003173.1/.p1  ORF type:complete len:666 (+),score=164.87 gb/GECH01003173.1/:1-1998(+)